MMEHIYWDHRNADLHSWLVAVAAVVLDEDDLLEGMRPVAAHFHSDAGSSVWVVAGNLLCLKVSCCRFCRFCHFYHGVALWSVCLDCSVAVVEVGARFDDEIDEGGSFLGQSGGAGDAHVHVVVHRFLLVFCARACVWQPR